MGDFSFIVGVSVAFVVGPKRLPWENSDKERAEVADVVHWWRICFLIIS